MRIQTVLMYDTGNSKGKPIMSYKGEQPKKLTCNYSETANVKSIISSNCAVAKFRGGAFLFPHFFSLEVNINDKGDALMY